MRRVLLLATVALAPVTAHAMDLSAPPDPSTIYGGGPVQACAWPTTVFVNDCTGTLVHPNVVVLAAHCVAYGGQASAVIFGEDHRSGTRTVPVSSCTAHPAWQEDPPGDDASDIAICELAQSVIDVPIVPILMGCEADALQPGTSATIVGFGDADDALGYGPKRQATTEIQQVGNDAVWIGGGGKSSCYGDSGGPAFLQLDDGSWRVFGATSGSATDDPGCGQTSVWTMIHPYAGWIEQTSGYDVTPCHDADGTWNPGETCSGFPMAPGSSGGSWANGCAGEASGIVESCGPGFGETADDTGDDTGGGGDGADDRGSSDGGEGESSSDDGDEDFGTDDGSDDPPQPPGVITTGATGSRGEGETACACTTNASPRTGWLVLLLAAFGRRRRARSD